MESRKSKSPWKHKKDMYQRILLLILNFINNNYIYKNIWNFLLLKLIEKISMKHVCNNQRHQHERISNSLIQNLSITSRSRCRRNIKILSMTHVRNCHEQNSEKWEDENVHCLHNFLGKKKLEDDENFE